MGKSFNRRKYTVQPWKEEPCYPTFAYQKKMKWNIQTSQNHIKPLQNPLSSCNIDGRPIFNLRYAINSLDLMSARIQYKTLIEKWTIKS